MKQTTASKFLLGIITILTVIAMLVVPAPVYASGPGHEPPPPKPGTNDMGKTTASDKGAPKSVSDLPEDTSLVVTNNGTALPLAAKLSVQALSPTTAQANSVKFCKNSNPDFFGACTSYASIEEAIEAVSNIEGKTSGVFYVALDYPTLPASAIVLDQSLFIDPEAASDLDMLGGYNFHGSHIGTQSVNPTLLKQPLTIMNINQVSSFTLDNFEINISDLAADTLDFSVPAALSVITSHNVTLSDLSVTNSAPGGVGAYLLDDYGKLSIKNSHFDGNSLAGLVVENFDGDVALENVTANNNGNLTPNVNVLVDGFMPPPGGAYISATSGNVTVEDSQFMGNGGAGLQVSTGSGGMPGLAAWIGYGEDGNIFLDGVQANFNLGPGAVLDTCWGLADNSPDLLGVSYCSGEGSISVTGDFAGNLRHELRDGTTGQYTSQFNNNGGPGLVAYSANAISIGFTEADYNLFNAVNQVGQAQASLDAPLFPTAEKAGVMLFALDNQSGPAVTAFGGQYAINLDRVNLFANDGDGVYASTPGSIRLDDVYADLNDGVGAYLDNCLVDTETTLYCTAYGKTDVIESGFDANTAIGLLALSGSGIYVGGSEASANAWAGAVLASPNSIGVTGSHFNGESDFYSVNILDFTPQPFSQPLGLAVVAGEDAYLGRPDDMPFYDYLPGDYGDSHGVQANGNSYAGAVILSGLDVLLESGLTGVASLDNLNALIAGKPSDVYVGSAEVSHSSFNGNGLVGLGVGSFDEINLNGVSASDNGVLGSLLLAGSNIFIDNSRFNRNGYESLALPGGSLADLLRDGVIAVSGLTGGGTTILDDTEANDNFFAGAVALSPNFVWVSDGQFNENGAGGLLAASLGEVMVVDTQANDNRYAGAVLAAIDPYDVMPFTNNSFTSSDSLAANIAGGFAYASGLEANGNGLLGAAVVGTSVAEVDHSVFTGNDWMESFSVSGSDGLPDLHGGGLLAVGGSFVSLNDVHADKNFGFGASAFNGGGFLSVFDELLNTAPAILDNLAPSAYAMDFNDLYDLPIFSQYGVIDVANSTFSGNEAWGLMAQIESHQGFVPAGPNFANGSIFPEGNSITLNNVSANSNGEFGILASIVTYDFVTPQALPVSGILPDSSMISPVGTSNFIYMNEVQANDNGDFGIMAYIDAYAANPQIGQAQFAAPESQNWISLHNVTANNNSSSGTILDADTISVLDSTFMYNGGFGLDLYGANSYLIDVRACHNFLGPEAHTGNLFASDFDTLYCPEEGPDVETGGGTGPEAPPMPWQIINVYMDPGKNGGTLSCQFGTTYLYLEKMGASAPDFEWARVELSPCIVPGGTTGTFTGLGQGDLPGAMPDGVTFLGKAFDFSLSGAASLGGAINVRFTLPAGFSLPSGKKLAILWFDPAAKQWVELTTYAGGVYANAYAASTGAFVLVLK